MVRLQRDICTFECAPQRVSIVIAFERVKTIHSPTADETIDLDVLVALCLVGFFTLAIHFSQKGCDWLIQIYRLLKRIQAEGFPAF